MDRGSPRSMAPATDSRSRIGISPGQRRVGPSVELVRMGIEKGPPPFTRYPDGTPAGHPHAGPARRRPTQAAWTRGMVPLRRFPAGSNLSQT